jgi:peptidoglycan/LPS O-acetylase OafA/YrhL
MTVSPATRKNQEIEILRGVAVLLAILTHLPIIWPYHNDALVRFYMTQAMPASGVDLFFCISGFVVSRAFLDFFDRMAGEGRFALAFQVFWIRRAFRLLPTSWLWVIVGLVLSVAFNSTGQFATPWDNLRSALVVVTMTGNIANQFGGLLYPNDIYWSLALEEQFYLLFPLFLLVVASPWRWRVLLLLVGVQFFLDRNMNILSTPRLTALLWAIRLDSIMWGVLLFLFTRTAAWRRLEPTFLGSSPVLRTLVQIVLVYLLVAIPVKLIQVQVSMGLLALVAAALVFLASFERGYAVPARSLSGFFAWVGARSYAVYIIHITAFRLTLEGWSRYALERGAPLQAGDTVPMFVTAALLLFGLVELNYRFVEMPMRDKGKELAQRRLARATVPPAAT